ncbi:MAG: class B sortase [Lachnospiraceae bacterium]
MEVKMKKQGKIFKCPDGILLATGIVSLVVFVAAGWKLLDYYRAYREQKQSYDEIAALRDAGNMEMTAEKGLGESGSTGSGNIGITSKEDAKASYERLKEINPDYVGWITIPDTEVDYPVVQRDNSYYLYHDFMGKQSSHGAIFLDENCEADDAVILIHGHHMKDGTMFGALKGFKKKDFRENHESLYLDWGEGDKEYRIFAVALIDLSGETYFHYDELPHTGEETDTYLKRLKQNAFWYVEPELEEQTQIVLLSTCEYGTENQRMVIAAVSETAVSETAVSETTVSETTE